MVMTKREQFAAGRSADGTTRRRATAAVAKLAVLCFALLSRATCAETATVRLRNKELELNFSGALHGFALDSIVCRDTGASFVEKTEGNGFWEITLRSAVDGSFVTLNGKSACRARRVIPTRGGGGGG